MKKILTIIFTIFVITISPNKAYADLSKAEQIGITSGAVYSLIDEIYIGNINKDDAIEGAIRGIVDSLGDKHSQYFSNKEYENFKKNLNNEDLTLGVLVYENDGFITVSEVLPDSIADYIGIMAGDKILSIDEIDINIENIFNILKDKKIGDKINIKISRNNKKIMLNTVINPQYTVIYKPISEVLNNKKNDKIGYIKIQIIGENTHKEFKNAINIAKKNGNNKIILDLRGNLGGSLEETIKICNEIVPKGHIVYVKNKNGDEKIYDSNLENPPFYIAVLTDEYTASGAEIIASAIKESDVGITIGGKTYGKGTVQEIIPLLNGGFLKITTSEFFSRNNNKINKIGILPDIAVPPVMLLKNDVKIDDKILYDTLIKLGYIKNTIKTKEKIIKDTKKAIKNIKMENNLGDNAIIDEKTLTVINNKVYNYVENIDEALLKSYIYLEDM